MSQPRQLRKLTGPYIGRWIPVDEALPPERVAVVVAVRGDDFPAFGYLKYSGGERHLPYFVVPQVAAMKPRGASGRVPAECAGRTDVTLWFSATAEGIPWPEREAHYFSRWGLNGSRCCFVEFGQANLDEKES